MNPFAIGFQAASPPQDGPGPSVIRRERRGTGIRAQRRKLRGATNPGEPSRAGFLANIEIQPVGLIGLVTDTILVPLEELHHPRPGRSFGQGLQILSLEEDGNILELLLPGLLDSLQDTGPDLRQHIRREKIA